ncbi:unnamed protein product [Xylocopa violacea]|uniref:Uncharacterized protein n=1 Tax=Xylocopa violacea TaxID=135666 RepID=A0ABP1NL71_XYLVO
MPLNKDTVDKEALRAHHLLHRSCRGKAHGNGIAKQSNRRATISLPAIRFPKDRGSVRSYDEASVVVANVQNARSAGRRTSRNGVSSWECSDSDSMHSSEAGQNAFATMNGSNRSPSANAPIRVYSEQASNGAGAKKQANRAVHLSSCLSKAGTRSPRKKESWADTLRVGSIDDRIKRMEEGWDDSSVIKTPRERKWRRITAEIEQRVPGVGKSGDFRILGLRGSSLKSWNNGAQKWNRKNVSQRSLKPIEDIIEWEEIVEMALAKKIGRGRGKRRLRDGEDVVDEGVNRCGAEGEPAKGAGECMKRLEVLLQNTVPPQTVEVCRYWIASVYANFMSSRMQLKT